MKKRLIVLALAALLCVAGDLALADQDVPFQYYAGGSGGAVIYQYTGSDTNVVIPSELNNVPVVEVNGFEGNAQLVSVTIPETVKTIGYSAFQDCTSLSRVIFEGKGIETIRGNAFEGCTSLKEIHLPHSLKTIEWDVFKNCTALESFTLTPGVEGAQYSFLTGCTRLKEIIIEEGVREIPDYFADDGLTGLTSITIPASVERIGYMAFYGAVNLRQVNFPKISDSGLILADWAFGECPIQEIKLPKNTKKIGTACFYDNEAASSLDIPDSVTELGSSVIPCTMIVGENSKALQCLLERGEHGYALRETMTEEVAPKAKKVDDKVKAIVSALIRPGMSDYEKALTLHDYLIHHANYDHDYKYYNADGVLLHGKGVCQSYTLAYQKLLNAVGIKNATETGDNHIWNMIQLDGDWYHVDCTWDDPGDGGYENHTYFCVTNYALGTVDSHECESKKHIATAYQYNFAYKHGGLNPRIEALKALIAEHALAGENSFAVTPEHFAYGWDQGILDRTSIQAVQDQLIYAGDTALKVALRYEYEGKNTAGRSRGQETPAGTGFEAPPPDPTLVPRSEEHPVVTVQVLERYRVQNMGSVTIGTGEAIRLPLPEGAKDAVFKTESANLRTDGMKVTALGPGEGTVTADARGADGTTIQCVYTVSVLDWSTLQLPAQLTAVEADAFRGSPAERVIVGAEVAKIQAGAFAGMKDLQRVSFSGVHTEIAEGAFDSTDGLIFFCPAGSRAEAYAKAHGIEVQLSE